MMSDGPTFLCVGLQKAGTQWLYDQLQNHPDFWMPPHKELHYFDQPFPISRLRQTAIDCCDAKETFDARRTALRRAPVDERGIDFYKQVLAFEGPHADLEYYARLFRAKGDKLSGDITPAYCILDRSLIYNIAKRFPEARICIMLREPVARLWSQWRMVCLKREAPQLATSYSAFASFVQRPEVIHKSFPTKIVSRWSEYFNDRLRYFFLDDVVSHPEITRATIISYLGGNPANSSIFEPSFNRKQRSLSADRSLKIQSLMKRLFKDERDRCSDLLGGAALGWPQHPY